MGHKVTDVIDGGEFVARSHWIPILEGINVVGMQRLTWPQLRSFKVRFICQFIDRCSAELSSAIRREPPERYLRNYRELIEACVQSKG